LTFSTLKLASSFLVCEGSSLRIPITPLLLLEVTSVVTLDVNVVVIVVVVTAADVNSWELWVVRFWRIFAPGSAATARLAGNVCGWITSGGRTACCGGVILTNLRWL